MTAPYIRNGGYYWPSESAAEAHAATMGVYGAPIGHYPGAGYIAQVRIPVPTLRLIGDAFDVFPDVGFVLKAAHPNY